MTKHMKLIALALLACLTAVVYFAWPTSAKPDEPDAVAVGTEALDRASARLSPAGGPSTGVQGLLAQSDALVVNRAAETLLEIGPDVYKPRSSNIPAVDQLVKRAREQGDPNRKPRAGTVLEQVDLARLGTAEKQLVARKAEDLILDIAVRWETAALDDAIVRLVRAEVELRVLLDAIRNTSGSDAGLVSDPLALAPTDRLESAREGLRVRRRAFADIHSLAPTPFTEEVLRSADSLVTRVDKILGSEEHRAFRDDPGAVLRKIKKSSWDDAMRGFEERVQAETKRSLSVTMSETGWAELAFASNSIRGPPAGSLDDMIWTTLREFDTDPRRWAQATARLQALADELADDRFFEVPVELRREPSATLRRVFALADDQTLRLAKDLLRRLNTGIELPDAQLFPGRKNHFTDYAVAVDAELERRRTGGRKVAPGITLAALIASTVKVDRLTPRAEANLLGLVQERFPRQEFRPIGLRDDIREVRTRTLGEYAARIEVVLKEYQKLADLLALSTDAAGSELVKRHKDTLGLMKGISAEFGTYVADAELDRVESPAAKKVLALLLSIIPRGPPDPPAPTAPVPSDPKKPPPSGLRVTDRDLNRYKNLSRTDPRLDKCLYFIEADLQTTAALLERIKPDAELLSQMPIEFGTQTGRRTLSRADIEASAGSPDWTRLPTNPELTRLPGKLKDWKGRLTPDGKPYDYLTEVKNPTTFRAVGGGIHFGELAKPDGAFDVSKYVLRYDAKSGLHLYNGVADKTIVVEVKVEPITLKSLYRFAKSGRNAAISIGWGIERPSGLDLLAGTDTTSPVLLDPFLVDTPVGQDLILADSIPWRLDQMKLPNGREISFHKEFGQGLAKFRADQRAKVKPLIESVPAFDDESRKTWAKRLDRSDVPVIVQALVAEESLDRARDWFVRRSIRDDLKREGIVSSDDTAEADVSRFIRKEILKQNKIASETDLTPEGLAILTKETTKALASIRKKLVEQFDSLNSGLGKSAEQLIKKGSTAARARIYIISDFAMLGLSAKGVYPRPLIELWLTLLPTEKKGDELVQLRTDALLAQLNTTTLAMLYDDAVKIAPEGAKVTGRMKYRYATSAILIEAEMVKLTAGSKESEVNTIEGLTILVTEHLSDLITAYQPLERVKRYAELVAFMRWAIEARDAGQLAAIDLSGLADTPAHERDKFPTADAIKK